VVTPDDAVERELRERFARLRDHDRAGAPPFASVVARARRGPATRRLVVLRVAAAAAALALAGGAVAALARWRGAVSPADVAEGGTTIPGAELLRWRAPTDFLLDTPGGHLLREVPRFGEALDSLVTPPRAPRPARPPAGAAREPTPLRRRLPS
jgi:hypothetical protein